MSEEIGRFMLIDYFPEFTGEFSTNEIFNKFEKILTPRGFKVEKEEWKGEVDWFEFTRECDFGVFKTWGWEQHRGIYLDLCSETNPYSIKMSTLKDLLFAQKYIKNLGGSGNSKILSYIWYNGVDDYGFKEYIESL